MILGFEYFHPLNGEPPNTLHSHCKDITYKARTILKSRSIADLHNIAAAINWITSHESVRNVVLDSLIKDAEHLDNNKEPEYQGNISTAMYAIKFYQLKHSLPDTTVNNLQWHEIYATLALTFLDQALNDEHYYSTWPDDDEWLHDWRILSHSVEWIIEAMEAITFAEGLLSIKTNIDSTKNKLSERNTAAAIQRHSKTNIAILELAKLFGSGNFKSMRNAAQIYCEKFPEKVSHLAHYNRVRTLSDGLSSHLKGLRRSIKPS